MNTIKRASAQWALWHIATLFLPVAGTSCTSQNRVVDPAPSAQAQPLRVESIEVQTQGQVQALAAGASIHAEQDFALKLRLDHPLHLYVVLEHADQSRALLHPAPAALGSTVPASIGSLRIPAIGDWFFLPKVLAGDRLCLIASLDPQSNFSCGEPSTKAHPGRGEDQPPPPPAREVKAPAEPKRPPPPDDTDGDRGKTRWVLPLPLSTP